MTDDKRELDDLPELPELAELKDLPELPEIDDLPDLPADVDMTPTKEPEVMQEPELYDELEPLDSLDQKVDEMPELPEEAEEELEPLAELEPVPAPAPKPVPVPERVVAPKPEPVVKREPAPKPEPVAAIVEVPVSDAAPEAVAPAPVAAAAALAPGEKPPLRVLDKALVHLSLASKIVVIGALVPFMKPTNEATLTEGLGINLGAKAIILLAAWLWYLQALENWEPKLKGVLKGLASFKLQFGFLKKKEDDKKKPSRRVQQQAPTALEHPFPTGLHLLSIVLMIAAIVVAVQDPRQGVAGPLALAEVGMLGWAAFTFVHIAAYERWGSFNPLFPLMFLGMLFSGLASIAAGIGAEGGQKIACFAGGLGVAIGGGLAAYTIVESMMEAKKKGDLKKAEAIEARKAARKARKS